MVDGAEGAASNTADTAAGDGGGGARKPTGAEAAALRRVSVHRLVWLADQGLLTGAHVRTMAEIQGMSVRTVWRWLDAGRTENRDGRKSRERFEIDAEIRRELAVFRGNAAALHRDMVKKAKQTGAKVPSLATIQRAIRRDLNAGDREGLRAGERARTKFDVRFRRPAAWRNQFWEGDHKQADVFVDVNGESRKPWVTWFVDTGSGGIVGVAITPIYPSRESVLMALRASILRSGAFGPLGGLPEAIRIDRGKDFLARAVAESMAYFGVEVHVLPGYAAHLKGRVEAANGAIKEMLYKGMPRYTESQVLLDGKPSDRDAPMLTFERFVAEVFGFVRDWNEEWSKDALSGRTPLQVWNEDPTPIYDPPEEDLALYTLEEAKAAKITTKGVKFSNQWYVGPGMNGKKGTRVKVRWMPNHPERIDIIDAATDEYLGAAHPNDQAPPEVLEQVLKDQKRKRKQLQADLKAADERRNIRYAAATEPGPPQILGSVSALQAAADLQEADGPGARRRAQRTRREHPELFEPGPPAPGWVLPGTARARVGRQDDTSARPSESEIGTADGASGGTR